MAAPKKPKYLPVFPKPLLDDLVADAWLPVVGAGLSRNALIPPGEKMPLWDDLGRSFAEELENYPYAGALDAISAYAHEYGRTKLIERLGELLHVQSSRPSKVHRAFCEIPFRIVCTTNFDFLLERQYGETPNYCRPIIDEQQLAVNSRESGVALLKLHGDLHHPGRLVVTEGDYDAFLSNHPLLATYLANLLITRTAVLIGYSLDDPDFRQIWNIVNERLGRSRRTSYALLVDAKQTDISRYERRGVKVISLPGDRANYADILSETFEEIREYVQSRILPASQITEEEPRKELTLPHSAQTRLCFFALPLRLHSLYKEHIFPLARDAGLVPILATDVISPGDNYVAKVSALIERAAAVVVDESSPFTMAEIRLALQSETKAVLMILPEEAPIPSDLTELPIIRRPADGSADFDPFLTMIGEWFNQKGAILMPKLADEPKRLLGAREYRAAVVSAMTLLETELLKHLPLPGSHMRHQNIRMMVINATNDGRITPTIANDIMDWIRLRNEVVHTDQPVPASQAREVVLGVTKVISSLRS